MTPARLALLALATARLTRFVTTDWLGEWWLVRPAKRWAVRREPPATRAPTLAPYVAADDAEPAPDNGWRSKLVHGLDCPFCVGFWIGGAVLVGEAATRRAPRLRGAWTLALGALALNYLVGHVSSRIDQ